MSGPIMLYDLIWIDVGVFDLNTQPADFITLSIISHITPHYVLILLFIQYILQDVSSSHIFLLSGVSTLRIPDGSLVNSVSEIGLSTSSNQHSIGLCNTLTSGVDGGDVIDANMSMNECGSKVAIASVSDDVMPSESDDVIHDESDDAVFCSVDAWMAQWQMLAVHRPILVQVLHSLTSSF